MSFSIYVRPVSKDFFAQRNGRKGLVDTSDQQHLASDPLKICAGDAAMWIFGLT